MWNILLPIAGAVAGVCAHGDHGQVPIAGPHASLWYNTLPGDGGTQVGLAKTMIKRSSFETSHMWIQFEFESLAKYKC